MIEPTTSPPPIEPEAKTWAMACHLSALTGFIGIPFGHLIGPLVFWLVRKDRYPFVDDQGKESLNFQLSMTIYACIAAVLVLVFVGIPLLAAIVVFDIVMVVIASVHSSRGEAYRYPLTIRLIP